MRNSRPRAERSFPNIVTLAVLLCCDALLFVGSIGAQTSGTGAVSGKVTDSSGAVIPSVQVQITNQETGVARTVPTSADGVYRATLLPPGEYTVSAQATGFQTATVHNVAVRVTETAVVDLTVSVGKVETQIEVTAQTEMVQTSSAALGRATSEEVIVAIPLANRNFTQILGLSPGVSAAIADAGGLGKNTQNVSANGARPFYNTFQFNGLDATNVAENTATGFGPEVGVAIPAPDTIQEFKVQTGLFDASYGRGIGATVDVVSKTGTNQYHGTLWEFFRNDALNANDFFLNRNHQKKPVLKQNQFGFTFGAPIRKNKLFYFLSYQGTRQVNGVSPLTSTSSAFLPPLTDDRSRTALGRIFGGKSGAFGGTAVANDGSNINPVALALLNFKFKNGQYAIPTPQAILSSGVGQSTFSVPGKYDEDQFTVNMDYTVNDKNFLSGRFFYSSAPQKTAFLTAGATIPGWGDNLDSQNRILTISDTHQFSSRLVNEARVGYVRFAGIRNADEPILASDIGMQSPTNKPGMAFMTISGLFNMGPSSTPEFNSITNLYQGRDTVSYVFAKHSVKSGFELKRSQVNTAIPFSTRGVLGFQSFPDFLLGLSAAQNGTAFSNVFSTQADNGLFDKGFRYLDLGAFAQDDITVSSHLTVNAGLRWDFFGPPSEVHGRMGNFILSQATQEPPTSGTLSGIVVPSNSPPVPTGVARQDSNALWPNEYRDFSPRFGFAYRPGDHNNFVIRGGYGIYYQRLSGQIALNTVVAPPYVFEIRTSGASSAAATLQKPFPTPLPPVSAFPVFPTRTPTTALSLTDFDPNIQNTYVQSYTLNFQYGFGSDYVAELGYVGSKTTRLPKGFLRFNQALIATPANPVHGVTTTTVANTASRVPWLGASANSAYFGNGTNANYNSLQASLNKRFRHGVEFEASYTWSKSLDCDSGRDPTNGAEFNPIPGDQTNICASNYAPSGFDRTQRFILSYVYNFPSLKIGPAIIQQIVSGWQTSGVLLFQSGVPFSVVDSRGASIYGVANNSYANCTGADPPLSGTIEDRLNAFFNTAAFAAAPPLFNGTGFGNCRRNLLRGPDQRNLDASLQKTIKVTERSNLLFRAEFYNLTNTPKFGLPGNNLAAPQALGVISSTVANPRVIQFALKYSF